MKVVPRHRSRAGVIPAVVEELRAGRVVICPSDTCYIFAADALNPVAIRRVWSLKGTQRRGPIHVLVSDSEMAGRLVHMNDLARSLLMNGEIVPLTIILPKRPSVPDILTAGTKTLGIRLPVCSLIIDLASSLGSPLTATSANPSGGVTPYSLEEAIGQLGPRELPRLAIDSGDLPKGQISMLLDLTRQPPTILREGSVSRQAIADALKERGFAP